LDPLPVEPALLGALQVREAGLDVERRRHRRPPGDVRLVEQLDQVVEIVGPPLA
jgi:hypothetical protein